MCRKFLKLDHDEALDLIGLIESGEPIVMSSSSDAGAMAVYPQSPAPLITPAFDTAYGVESFAASSLVAQELRWGFEEPWTPGVVFNTRIESADKPTWADSMLHRRCVVPARAFFESHGSETVVSPRTGRPVKRQFEFRMPGQDVILIGCIWKAGCFSMVTTDANASMASIHDRMPLVVRPEELLTWLGPDYRMLADRSRIKLEAEPVTPVGVTPSLF